MFRDPAADCEYPTNLSRCTGARSGVDPRLDLWLDPRPDPWLDPQPAPSLSSCASQFDKHVSFSRVWLGCKDVFSPRPERRQWGANEAPCPVRPPCVSWPTWVLWNFLINQSIDMTPFPIVADVCSNYMQTYIHSMNEIPSEHRPFVIYHYFIAHSLCIYERCIVLGRCCFMATTSTPTMMMMTTTPTTLLSEMRGKSRARYLTNMRGKSQARFGPKAAASLRANLRK